VIAEYPASHWVKNLHAHPHAQVRLGDKRFPARARMVSLETESELHRTVQEMSREKYGWGEGLVVELIPEFNPI